MSSTGSFYEKKRLGKARSLATRLSDDAAGELLRHLEQTNAATPDVAALVREAEASDAARLCRSRQRLGQGRLAGPCRCSLQRADRRCGVDARDGGRSCVRWCDRRPDVARGAHCHRSRSFDSGTGTTGWSVTHDSVPDCRRGHHRRSRSSLDSPGDSAAVSNHFHNICTCHQSCDCVCSVCSIRRRRRRSNRAGHSRSRCRIRRCLFASQRARRTGCVSRG